MKNQGYPIRYHILYSSFLDVCDKTIKLFIPVDELYVMLKTKSYGVILVVALSVILGTGIVLAQTTIEISITPATLNLYDVVDKCVTVHTNIGYAEGNTYEWDLNGVEAAYTKADSRGYLVVKFDREEIAENVDLGEEVTLTLTGVKDQTTITGEDTIRVINQPFK